MKVITWNCNMAFRKKAETILDYKPDILVIQECEHPDKLVFGPGIKKYSDACWFGTNQHKGLGIFSFGKYRITQSGEHHAAIKMVVPLSVTGGEFDFTLFAIWANNPDDPDGQYVEQVWKALQYYADRIGSKTMLIGDFNSNTIWDRKYRTGNHSHVVQALEEKGIFSCYHVHHKQVQGKEKHPTFYLYRHKDKKYHLDYCFISSDMKANLKKVVIGKHAFWKQYSDHVPMMISFHKFEKANTTGDQG